MQNFWLHKQNRMQEILDDFDFDKVRSVMQHLNWKWSFGNNVIKVPTVDELKAQAEQLLKDTDTMGGIVGIGGFEAEKIGDELTLKFVVEAVD